MTVWSTTPKLFCGVNCTLATPPSESAIQPSCERRIFLPRPKAHWFQLAGSTRNSYTLSNRRSMRTVMVRDSTVTVWVPAAIAIPLPKAQLSNPITMVRRTILRNLLMHETLHVSSHDCLERIGQSAPGLGDEFARGYAAHPPDFAGHVRLVCVACAHGQIGEVVVFGSQRKL